MINLITWRRLFLAQSRPCCLAIAHLQEKARSVSGDRPWRCSLKWSLTLPRTSKDYGLKEWLQEGSLEIGGVISWTLAVKLKNTLPRKIRQLKSISGFENLRMQKNHKQGTFEHFWWYMLCICKQPVPGKERHLEAALCTCFSHLIASICHS